MNLLTLPSGIILNLDNVAWIAPVPNTSKSKTKISVRFCATLDTGSSALNVELDEIESLALLEELSRRGLDTSALREKTGIEKKNAVNLALLAKGASGPIKKAGQE
jgi:hypothetical protein